ncbi:MAG: DUF115 domain-containing protein [Spirochaetales bacterium]|nr:DUF115 domain-containing protein [Spirochaetales bacterium]
MTNNKDRFSFFPARNGLPAGQFDGISLCSRHDPRREGERIAANRDRQARAALFLGFGMGYQVEAYLEATEEIPLIVVEKEAELFQEVCRHRDFTALAESGRVFFFPGGEPEDLTSFFREKQISRFDIIPHGTLFTKDRDYYEEVRKVAHRWLDRREINMNTLNRFGRLWVRNLAANLPLLARGEALSRLKDQFSDLPALLVAAGPTLEQHLPLMKDLADRVVIIAVDTSFGNLQKHGVEADFLVVTDPQYWNTRHLDFSRLDKTIVISDTSVHPRTLRNHSGPLFLSRSPFPLASVLEKDLLDISLKSGGSVATAAWDLAFILGCNSVYCAGLDLGFPGKQTHCRGSFFEERVNYLSTRTAGPEQWTWQALHSAPLFVKKNYQGRPILSDQRMQVYISWFSEQVKKSQGKTWNLSGRGSFIDGMPLKEIRELLTLPLRREEIEQRKGDLLSRTVGHDRDVQERVENLIDSLDCALRPVVEAEKTVLELEEAFLRGQSLEELLKRLDGLDREIAREAAREIGGFLIQPHLQAIEESQAAGGIGIIRNSLSLYRELGRSLRYHRDIFYSRSKNI